MMNIHELALPIINTVVNEDSGYFAFRYFLGQEINDLGVGIPTFSKWYGIKGNVQYVPRKMYEELGLEFTKVYINAWASVEINDNAMKSQPDQLFWRGFLWNVTSNSEWNWQNGWVNVTAVKDKRYVEEIKKSSGS